MENLSNTKNFSKNEISPVLLGEQFFKDGRIDEARDVFLSAIEDCPGNALAWNNLAVIAMMEKNERQAENYLRKALEVKHDFLDARFNLAEIYSQKKEWRKAERELKTLMEINPGNVLAGKHLAQIYLNSGQSEKAKELLEQFNSLGAMKDFIDSLWLGIKYCAMQDDLSAKDKLEKFTVAVLKFLDGLDGQGRRYKLLSKDMENGEEIVLEDFYSNFYYKEQASSLIDEQNRNDEYLKLVLTIGDNDDWLFFREALRDEMKAEGGCLGNFTQSRKVLRRESRLSKYDLEASLNYFHNNVGPCDCHVLRAVLI